MKNMIVFPVLLAALFSGSAYAEPKNGFSVNAGTASHSRDSASGASLASTSGLSLGMDYQFALPANFSISPFLMTSSETISGVSGTTAGHGILGGQLRYWAGDVFVGAHLGSYSEVFVSGNTSTAFTGGGAGLVAGWEQPDGGLYVMGQYDSAKVSAPGYFDNKFTALRLSVEIGRAHV